MPQGPGIGFIGTTMASLLQLDPIKGWITYQDNLSPEEARKLRARLIKGGLSPRHRRVKGHG